MAENEEPKTDVKEEQPDEVSDLKAQVSELLAKTKEYEKLLLSDDFVNFVASKAAEKADTKGKASEEVDFENMSKKDLVQFILTAIDGRVNKMVQPVAQDAAVIRAQQQVKEAAEKYPDYWDYKDAMLEIASKTPGLTAEDCYHLAKGRLGGKPPKPVHSELPSNHKSRKKEEPVKGLPANFDKAWKQVFGAASQAS